MSLRTEAQIRAALKSRPDTGLQNFREGAALALHKDLFALGLNMGDYHVHFEQFHQLPGINGDLASATEATRVPVNRSFEISGTNCSSDDVTFDEDGGLCAVTDGADGDSIMVFPHQDTKQSWYANGVGADKRPWMDFKMKTGGAIASQILGGGLKLTATAVVATDADQCWLRYEDDVNGGRWQFVVSVNGTDYTYDTGIAVAANTTYRIRIIVNEDGVPSVYINGAHAYTAGVALLSTASLKPFWVAEADGAAVAVTAYLRHIALAAYAA